MKIRYILILMIMLSPFVSIQNSYSYHILNSLFESTFVFRSLPGLSVDFNVDGGTLGGGNGLVIIQDACDEWDSLPNIGNFCGNLVQIETDITSSNFNTIIGENDGTNDIVFDENGSILANLGVPGVLGLGFTTFITATGQIVDITIIINGSIPSSPSADQLATIIHEMGHTWGLAHIPIGGISTTNSVSGFDRISPAGIPTMFPFAIPQDDRFGRSLESDDLGSALLLYGP